MDKKYELTDITKTVLLGDVERRTVVLHRIRALIDFGDVKKGDLGGWVENENVLSHEDECWIGDNAEVYRDGIVCDNAQVYNNAKVIAGRVCGNAEVFGYATVNSDAWVCDNAKVYDYARIHGNCSICGKSKVYGHTQVYGCSTITGNVEIYDYAQVYDNAYISGDAKIYDVAKIHDDASISGITTIHGTTEICGRALLNRNTDISKSDQFIIIGPLGSRNDYTTFYRNTDGVIMASTGCFGGTLDEFKNAVKEKHKSNKRRRNNYLQAIKYVKKVFKNIKK